MEGFKQRFANNPFDRDNYLNTIFELRRLLTKERELTSCGISNEEDKSRDEYSNDFDAIENDNINTLRQNLEEVRSYMELYMELSEEEWLLWIEDQTAVSESDMAKESLDELYAKAISHYPISWNIWKRYLAFLHEARENDYKSGLEEDDHLFTQSHINEIITKAARATDTDPTYGSQLVWKAVLSFYFLDQQNCSDDAKKSYNLEMIRKFFHNRLRQPHLQLQETFDEFSNFISTYFNENYESELTEANKIKNETLRILRPREKWEELVNTEATMLNFSDYIDWEKTRPKKQQNKEYILNLYERVLMVSHFDDLIWNDYLTFLMDRAFQSNIVRPVLKRATQSCPDSGLIWSQYIILLTRFGLPLETVEAETIAKLDLNPLFTLTDETAPHIFCEWKLIQLSWLKCLPLLEDTQSFENGVNNRFMRDIERCIDQCANYGGYDPFFELESYIVEILPYRDQMDHQQLRDVWRKMIPQHGKNTDFWVKWVDWEKRMAGKVGDLAKVNSETYKEGSTIYQLALSKHLRKLDDPERLIREYTLFERVFGTIDSWVDFSVRVSKAYNVLNKERMDRWLRQQELEKEQYAQNEIPTDNHDSMNLDISLPTTNETSFSDNTAPVIANSVLGKRKSEELIASEGKPVPKVAKIKELSSMGTATSTARDREHLTVIVSSLPESIDEAEIIKLFESCGELRTITLNEATHSAIVEFDNEDDFKTGLTRDFKTIRGQEVRVNSGENTTVWVTNFPKGFEEDQIRTIFNMVVANGSEPHEAAKVEEKKIISVRFPSLSVNSRRRFCYIQYSSAAYAQQAVSKFNNKSVYEFMSPPTSETKTDGDNNKDDKKESSYRLVVKISDPNQQKATPKTGALYEGREVYIYNIDNITIGERELEKAFSKFGEIERMKFPLNKFKSDNNKIDDTKMEVDNGDKIEGNEMREMNKVTNQYLHDGYGFISFKTKEQALAAVKEMDLIKLGNKVIRVEIAAINSNDKHKKPKTKPRSSRDHPNNIHQRGYLKTNHGEDIIQSPSTTAKAIEPKPLKLRMMVPRNVRPRVKLETATTTANTTANVGASKIDSTGTPPKPPSSTPAIEKKNNDFFRDMFLKK